MAVFYLLRSAVESSGESCNIGVETEGDDEHVHLLVSDTCHIIPREVLEKIFDPFYKAELYRFGMGLPLIKQIISEHLGEIHIESEPGSGTTFKITFPKRWKEHDSSHS